MRLIRWITLICVVLLLVYGVSPYFSFWRFTVALRAGDAAAVSSHVDFPAIRVSLKKQLVARFASAATGNKRWSKLGPTLIDAIVDAYATPDGLAALISAAGVRSVPQRPPSGAPPSDRGDAGAARRAVSTRPGDRHRSDSRPAIGRRSRRAR